MLEQSVYCLMTNIMLNCVHMCGQCNAGNYVLTYTFLSTGVREVQGGDIPAPNSDGHAETDINNSR